MWFELIKLIQHLRPKIQNREAPSANKYGPIIINGSTTNGVSLL